MTPPKISPLKFHLSGSSDNEPTKGLRFFPELNLQGMEGVNPSTTLPSHRFRLTETQLDWSLPRLWEVKAPILLAQSTPPTTSAAPIPPSPPAAATQTGWSGAQVFKFITDTLLLIETLDAKSSDMISNGGEGGCRYEEMAQRSDVPKLLNKCLVKFEPDTRASVDVQLRKLQGSNTESLITIFRVRYDKNIYKDEFPDNQVRVQGFQFTPTPQKPLPFDVAVSPFAQMGYSIRYMVEPAGLLGVPLLGYPIFRLSAQPSEKLDLTKDFFQALGIDKPEYYTEVGTAFYKSPQTVRGFMKLMDHIESDDDKLQVVNINTLKGRPRLFDWLSFKKIDWVSRLREGSLLFPGFGSFTFTRKTAYEKIDQITDPNEKIKALDHTARLEIHGSQAKLNVSFENIELADAHFKVGDQDVTIKGMRAGKIKTSIPGIKELIRQVKAGIFGSDKLHLEAEDVFIEDLIIKDNKNEITTHLKNVQLNKFIFNGSSHISAFDLRAQSLDVESNKLNIGFHIENARIHETHFTKMNGLEELSMPRIEGGKTQIRYSNNVLKANSSVFEALRWTESKDQSLLTLQSLSSSGSISHETPNGISFETNGSSKLQNINFGYLKSGLMTASLELSGKINRLKLNQDSTFQLNLTNAEFNPSKISVSLRINPETKNIENIHYNCDFKIIKTEFGQSKIGPVVLAPSSLREGEIKVIQESSNLFDFPSIELAGIFDLHLQSVTGKNESFNIPGLSVSGGIYGINLEGPAHFQTTKTGWIFERLETANHDKLHATAQVKDVIVLHDPHQVPGNTLRSWPYNQVVKSSVQLQSADLSIADIGKIEFVNGGSETQAENRLQNMLLEGIRVNNIQAAGVAWANFPLFYYMRGVFPQIGSLQQSTQVNPSFLSLDRFRIQRSPSTLPLTTFEGFQGEIYEVEGHKQFAKIKIPLLKISPQGENLLDTGNNSNEIELYLIDKARGGYIRLRSVPRPLESRRSRVVP